MIRFLIAAALLATPAFANEVCEVSPNTAQPSSPIVETSSLLEAFEQQPLAKRPRRITEAFHRALLDSTDVGLLNAWTSIVDLEEALEDEGVFNAPVAASMVERRMASSAAAAQQDSDLLSIQLHHVRRDYAEVLQAMGELAAERPKRQPIASKVRSYAAAMFFGHAAAPSTWQRNQLIRREALRVEKAEILGELRELTNQLVAAMGDRTMLQEAASEAGRIRCQLDRLDLPGEGTKVVEY